MNPIGTRPPHKDCPFDAQHTRDAFNELAGLPERVGRLEKAVIDRLSSLEEKLGKIGESVAVVTMQAAEVKELRDKLANVREDVVALKVKAAVIGVIAAMLTQAAIALISVAKG